MDALLVLTGTERSQLVEGFGSIKASPYDDYPAFSEHVRDLVVDDVVPDRLLRAAGRIRADRAEGVVEAHVLRNCPVDDDLPELGNEDPSAEKKKRKTTFVGEAFLELLAQITGTPLLAYANRFGGDFFIDVVAISRYLGKQTGYNGGEVVFHNDRTAHPVRADYITLLGMRCPTEDLVYTGFVPGTRLVAELSPEVRRVLREPHFATPFDVVSRDANADLGEEVAHPILSGRSSLRYLDTHTTTAAGAPVEAKDALLALKNALTRVPKDRHRMQRGDVLTFANQHGLHNREQIEITDPGRALGRWLLKTYAFADRESADAHADAWVDGVPGKVGD
ncbi:TauD/TfdA family dioxygenase [Umezawaea tangerina]|uniref:TfdA family taurine catabolism dioxygenase TauD n=1 Tax=Umezawaea tangerina TaxID=84725 RepID=A0A2T0SU21_9PSEU|nr:TauD/TfdA family dioxygenase [Umezawaea tangerina]PRY36917.1 TfdA family taurine catabolism dioxygenase TauD [Umezawaea tangerina]